MTLPNLLPTQYAYTVELINKRRHLELEGLVTCTARIPSCSIKNSKRKSLKVGMLRAEPWLSHSCLPKYLFQSHSLIMRIIPQFEHSAYTFHLESSLLFPISYLTSPH